MEAMGSESDGIRKIWAVRKLSSGTIKVFPACIFSLEDADQCLVIAINSKAKEHGTCGFGKEL